MRWRVVWGCLFVVIGACGTDPSSPDRADARDPATPAEVTTPTTNPTTNPTQGSTTVGTSPTTDPSTSTSTGGSTTGSTGTTTDTTTPPTLVAVEGSCVVGDAFAPHGDCSFTTDPPSGLVIELTAPHTVRPRRIELAPAPEHDVILPLLTSQTTWHWTATATDDPTSTIAGSLQTADIPPAMPIVADVRGTAVTPYVAASIDCLDDAWTVVFDARNGLPAWSAPVGEGQPESMRVTEWQTVITMMSDRVLEHDLQGKVLLDLPIDSDTLGVSSHHDVAMWGDWVYVVYNEVEEIDGRPMHDGVLVLDRDGTEVARLFLPDLIDVPQDAFGDYSHLNAANPTGDGDLLLSLRSQSTVLRVSADPDAEDFGAVRWQLTGSLNPLDSQLKGDFELRASDGAFETFLQQHDPTLLPDGRITLFDNRKDPAENSRLIDVRLDVEAGTATIERAWDVGVYCAFQGGARHLRGGGRLATCSPYREVHAFLPDAPEAPAWTMELGCRDSDHVGYIPRAMPVEL